MTAEIATITPRTQPMGITPANLGEAMEMAKLMASASIVPKDYQGNPGNVLVAIQWGAEIGLAPLQAMQNIAVINGRPSIWGDAALAIVRSSGALEYIRETDDGTTATCILKRRGEAEVVRTFSQEDAKQAGLAGKQGPWTQYPRRMRQMRARSWAIRDVFPDVLRGCHIAEEAQDIPLERAMGPAEVVESHAPATRTAAIKDKLASKRAKPPIDPAPDLDDVLSAIASAESMTQLNAAGALAARLDNADDKATARKAFADRKATLKAPVEPPPLDLAEPTPLDQILDGIARSPADDLDIWLDEARVQQIDEAGMARIMAAIEARTALPAAAGR